MRLIAHIPKNRRQDQIEWLVLEDDPSDTNGFYLFYHRSLNEPSEYDSWHQTMDQALMQAKNHYGLTKENWKAH